MLRRNEEKELEARVCKHNCVGGSANICNARKSGVERERERKNEKAREEGKKEKGASAINPRGRRVFRRLDLVIVETRKVTEQTFPADCTGVSLPLRLLLFVYYNLDTIISLSSSHPSRPR